MLSNQDIATLAQQHCLMLHAHFSPNVSGIEPPRAHSLTISFSAEAPEVWETLMTQLTEVPVTILGTRQVSASGALDNKLHRVYAERIARVNAARATIGLAPVRN